MPLPIPSGALATAHRICCLRCIRAAAKEDATQAACSFSSHASKKCDYCVAQKAECVPIPNFVGPEFQAYRDAATSGISEDVVAAAKALTLVVAVAAAEAPRGVNDAAFALLEEARMVRTLTAESVGILQEMRDEMGRITAEIQRLRCDAATRAAGLKAAAGGGGGPESALKIILSHSVFVGVFICLCMYVLM